MTLDQNTLRSNDVGSNDVGSNDAGSNSFGFGAKTFINFHYKFIPRVCSFYGEVV